MRAESGSSISIWMDTAEVPEFSMLQNNTSCDVCIIGAGITGLSTAYLLSCEGLTVVVLDDGSIAGGETQRTTAHITNVIDDRYYEIERIHGLANAQLAYESQTAAIDLIEQIVTEEKIACDFERLDGYLFSHDTDKAELLKELKTLQRINFADVELLNNLPGSSKENVPCLRFKRQAQFHVLKYLSGLSTTLLAKKGQIYTRTHVNKIDDGKIAQVVTENGAIIKARFIVVATNSPISDFVKVHTKQAAYRTFAIGGIIPAGSLNKALYWDTASPYHYLRLQATVNPNSHYLIIGGEDQKTGQKLNDTGQYTRLENWAREWFPMLENIDYRWSGQVYEPVDGLGFIGHDPAHGTNVFISTGDSGMGMTHGSMSAIIIRDLIKGMKNPWIELYKPSRKVFNSIDEYIKENLNTAAQYAKYFCAPDYNSIDQIPLEKGGIINEHGNSIAVYKDKQGEIFKFSALCPHLKAKLCWNDLEKSWDCPAHGSRFKATGEVIDGPANANMCPG